MNKTTNEGLQNVLPQPLPKDGKILDLESPSRLALSDQDEFSGLIEHWRCSDC
jgi:hypothetical protein